ncbi:MAG TPA: pyruvate, water dikinase regulatory protein [Burkholderiales bacterium]|nr:pyruvate, water dikinase regulatory protein [Burkholderiales bacterium]
MIKKRTAFFVSDRTGITAEMLGHSLLTQFEGIEFEHVTIPFLDSLEKAEDTAQRINSVAEKHGTRPIVFSTLVNPKISAIVESAQALFVDCFHIFIAPLEAELGIRSSHAVGRAHTAVNVKEYHQRIEAVNYTLAHDDGVSVRDLDSAQVILTGVSRSGKTPTCLYLALQFGIRSANYPLVPEDLSGGKLPRHLIANREKLYGLTINPERLQKIRAERRPGSDYASLQNCQKEVHGAEALMRDARVPFLDTTTKSIEELASTIVHLAKLARHVY